MSGSPYDDWPHVDCGCSDCLAAVLAKQQPGQAIPPDLREELVGLGLLKPKTEEPDNGRGGAAATPATTEQHR